MGKASFREMHFEIHFVGNKGFSQKSRVRTQEQEGVCGHHNSIFG